MKLYCSAILILLHFCSPAQTRSMDSLRRIIYNSKNETAVIKAMESLTKKALYRGEYDTALSLSKRTLALGQLRNEKQTVSLAYNNLGMINSDLGNYTESLKNHLEGLKIDEELRDTFRMAQSYNNIGNVYAYQKFYKEALVYYDKSLRLQNLIHDEEGIADAHNNIGLVEYYRGNYDKALENFNFSIAFYKKNNLTEGLVSSYINMALIYTDRDDFEKALTLYDTALAVAKRGNSKQNESRILNNVGAIYLDLRDAKKALPYLERSRNLATEMGAYNELQDVEHNLSDVSLLLGNGMKAYEHYVKYVQIRDSLVNYENSRSLMQMQLQYEFDKKENAVKAELEKNEIKSKEEKEKQRLLLVSVAFVLLVVIIFSAFLFKRFKLTQKQKAIIEEQKTEVEAHRGMVMEKNKEITDSIRYASQIQRVMLTSEDYISTQFRGEVFILYEPKDIVSGDFYWAVHHNNYFYMATADCTGHGVPGAFMSLLNISFLNETVVKRNVSAPSEILNQQREAIIRALNPTGKENSRDGMDCVLARFDFNNNELLFSAANNQLWLIRKGVLQKFKGDKMPVGKFNDVYESFKQHSIKLEPGDTIYTFTDGYADQFGGPQKKKFKYSRLEELLLRIHLEPFDRQKKILHDTISSWRSDLEQVDDILVIGARI